MEYDLDRDSIPTLTEWNYIEALAIKNIQPQDELETVYRCRKFYDFFVKFNTMLDSYDKNRNVYINERESSS